MKVFYLCLLASWTTVSIVTAATEPALRLVRAGRQGAPLLANGGFEQTREGRLPGWQSSPKGYRVGLGEGRGDSTALVCENPTGDGWYGASQTLTLNRTNVAPLLVRGWSKAQGVSGGADSGYSLYVDLLYADGTPLWGQTGNFRCGTHDWEQKEFIIMPEKPVRSLTVHCLFRGHAGQVWFDDVSVEEHTAREGSVLFQGVAVTQPAIEPSAPAIAKLKSPTEERSMQTHDGLRLRMQGEAIRSLFVDGTELTANAPSGLLARDVAANSDFFAFEDGACLDLGLKVQTELIPRSNHVVVRGRLSDTTGKDRAVMLLFVVPLDATGWRWGDDVRRNRVIQGQGEFVNQVGVRCGATGTLSLYPTAAVWNDRLGLALALDLAQPAVYRVGYHAGLKALFLAFDFGLVKETGRFPSSADFRFVLYRFDPRWGFRAAWQKYMEIFPEYFVVRAKEQGIWMPFTDVSTVQGWEDFGFKFHEGNNNVPWDDAHGILSFRYTEPMTWWMAMPKDAPRTLEAALRVREEVAQDKNEHRRRMAEASFSAAMFDEAGQPSLLFRNEPWCHGAVWSLNPNPWLGARTSLNAASVHWSEAIRDRLYGPTAKGRLDGEYLDSLEGYVTVELNFRREHFRDSTVPLTFSTDTRQPALFKGLAVFEFTKWMAEDVHRLDKLTFANGVPYRFTFLCPWLDIMGTETDWLRGGQYRPASLPQMDLWRTLSGAKPYLLLMNTDYNRFTPDLVEKYFQRCLFYGMFPSMFSHNAAENPYWKNPAWYNRDRPLFKKYIPLVKRVAEAGWQPLTEATCDNDHILVERFGHGDRGAVYFTAYNGTDQPQMGMLSVFPDRIGLPHSAKPTVLTGDNAHTTANGRWQLRLQSHQTAVLWFRN